MISTVSLYPENHKDEKIFEGWRSGSDQLLENIREARRDLSDGSGGQSSGQSCWSNATRSQLQMMFRALWFGIFTDASAEVIQSQRQSGATLSGPRAEDLGNGMARGDDQAGGVEWRLPGLITCVPPAGPKIW